MGPDLMVRMEDHAREMGTEIISDHIYSLDLSRRPFTAHGDSGTTYTADAVILATGAQAKMGLGLPSEEHFKGFGVSACATCVRLSSIAARRSSWWAAATPPWRRRCS